MDGRVAVPLVVFRRVGVRAMDSRRQREGKSSRKYTWKYPFYAANAAIEYAIQQSQSLPDPEWNRVPV